MTDYELELRPRASNADEPSTKILIVDDNEGLRSYVSDLLSAQRFQVFTATGGAEMDKILKCTKVELILLDSAMPYEDGLSICKRLHDHAGPAVIMLSGKHSDHDRIAGLTAGADDYVVKPFNPDELVARVHAVLRRQRQSSKFHIPSEIRFLGWSLHISKRQLTSPAQTSIALSSTEFALLSVFLDNQGTALSREYIQARMNELREDMPACALDTLISRFRRKLSEAAPGKMNGRNLIRTKYGIGYILPAEVN